MTFPFADLDLARRLERTEATGCAQFVESRAILRPESGAEWIDVAGTWAMFDGVTSPITQTFGLGMFEPVTPQNLDRIELFFAERGAPVWHEVSPLADPSALALLGDRGYRAIELSNVMYRPIDQLTVIRGAAPEVSVRQTAPEEWQLWATTSTRGWSEFTQFAPLMAELSEVGARRTGALTYLAERDGQPIGAGALTVAGGVALLAGASTVPEHRRLGAQLALLSARLTHAVRLGCDVAMIATAPGSASQRNAERHGFRIAYTRTKWQLVK
jgi:GNAT superfamily N-acetyltransferase